MISDTTRVAVTGGIGSGKSFVCQRLKDRGIEVFNCDDVAKWLMRERRDLQRRLVRLVGKDLYTDGRLNKAVMARFILASVDTSRLSEKELKTHEALQDAIVRREELRQMLNPQNEDVTEEQRKKTFEELRELDQKMHQLETSERNTLLHKTARSYGLSNANAKEMTEAIKAIYDATGGGGGRHGGFGGPPPGGPGGSRRR